MKWLRYIVLIVTLPVTSQNLYTNEPDLVYPILEEFIAENYEQNVPAFEKINQLDSIMVEELDYPLVGRYRIQGRIKTIAIHRKLLREPRRFERTLKHELGHVFGLPHINIDLCYEIMSSGHPENAEQYYADPEVWRRINSNYYKSLRNSNPK